MSNPIALEPALDRMRKILTISESRLRNVILSFQEEMRRGLAGEPGSLKMLPTYIDLPTGREKGPFLALDLGGTNVRIIRVDLPGDRTVPRFLSDHFRLSRRDISTDGPVLFGAIARFIGRFLQGQGRTGPWNMGFTFSFAIRQSSIDRGELIGWTKGWTAEGVVGRDVVDLLNRALAAEGIAAVKVVSLNNDTTGTLMAGAYLDPDCDVGCILGTGTNMCYRERTSSFRKPIGHYPGEFMIVNMESGNFDAALLRTPYDALLDARSENPGLQAEEKMVSGKYLGETARLIIADLVGRGMLFGGRLPEAFAAPGEFGSERLSEIEEDPSPTAEGVRSRLKTWGIEAGGVDARALREVARAVSGRAARLAAAVLVACVTKNDPALERAHAAAVDGSLYQKYSGFRGRMEETVRELLGARAGGLRLNPVPDGSGFGAAVIAAVSSR
ncbi:MAG: hypothetical protein JW843_10875 [Candidatus Aminicenantes bacterium]|nr:hypothetical protein [Candidatus Aminicenantes bacterium]